MGLKIRKGDRVRVISGRYAGVEGQVLEAYPKRDKVLVEGVNLVKKHQKATSQSDQGGIIEKELPIHISNVMLTDDSGTASRYANVTTEKGRKIRQMKRTGKEI